jgi:hypothetical protein
MNEQAVYGMSVADIRSEYMESLTARCSGLEMVVMGILSDCQELQAMAASFPDGQAEETIRQYLNRAKFILSTMMEANRAG